MEDLQRTSERVVADQPPTSLAEWATLKSHLATYRWATEECKGLEVLDYGCGTGYGTAMVAETAATAIGVDVAREAVGYASVRYPGPNLTFRTVSGPLPFSDASFDRVLSFQVLEHVDPHPYLSEVVRVLRPGGRALFATPNREVRLFCWQRPWNRWHLTEWDPDEFGDLLGRYFHQIELFELVGTAELLDAQLSTWQRNRWVTAPLTLPFVPDSLRRTGLETLSRLRGLREAAPIEDPGGEFRVAPLDGNGIEILASCEKK